MFLFSNCVACEQDPSKNEAQKKKRKKKERKESKKKQAADPGARFRWRRHSLKKAIKGDSTEVGAFSALAVFEKVRHSLTTKTNYKN